MQITSITFFILLPLSLFVQAIPTGTSASSLSKRKEHWWNKPIDGDIVYTDLHYDLLDEDYLKQQLTSGTDEAKAGLREMSKTIEKGMKDAGPAVEAPACKLAFVL